MHGTPAWAFYGAAVLSQTHRGVSQKLQIAESELQEATTAASLVASTKRIKSV